MFLILYLNLNYRFLWTKFIHLIFLFIWCIVTVNSYCDSYPSEEFSERTLPYKLKDDQQKKVIQNQILNVFGLKRRPNLINERYKRRSNSNYLNAIYNQYSVLKDDVNLITNDADYLSQTKEKINLSNFKAIQESDVIISFDSQLLSTISNRTNQFFRFNISKAFVYDNLIRSELVFYQNRPNLTTKSTRNVRFNIQINVKSRLHNVTLNQEMTKLNQNDNWVKIDFTDILKELIYDQELEIKVEISSFLMNDRNGIRNWSLTDFVNEFRKPTLVTYFKSNFNLHELNRIKRDLSSQQETKPTSHRRLSRKTCQLNSFFISFQELGWQDWIIAPEGYSSFFCSGQCSFPLKENSNATNHAIVQSLMQLINPSNYPKPCCAAIQYSSIDLLYLDEDKNVTWKKYNNMVPRSCGCV